MNNKSISPKNWPKEELEKYLQQNLKYKTYHNVETGIKQ